MNESSPKRLRDRLGIRAATVVKFREEGSTLVIGKKQSEDPVAAVSGILAGMGQDSDTVVSELQGMRTPR